MEEDEENTGYYTPVSKNGNSNLNSVKTTSAFAKNVPYEGNNGDAVFKTREGYLKTAGKEMLKQDIILRMENSIIRNDLHEARILCSYWNDPAYALSQFPGMSRMDMLRIYKDTWLMQAVDAGSVGVITILCKCGVDKEARNYMGNTAIMMAVMNNDTPMVEELYNNGANIEAKNKQYETPLIVAIQRGEKSMIDLLCVICKANVNATSSGGKTALMWACEGGDKYIVEQLCYYGAKVNATTNSFRPLPSSYMPISQNTSALMIASKKGYIDIVTYLCDMGADVNIVNQNQYTALMYACEEGQMEIVKILLKNGAKVIIDESMPDTENNPEMIARKHGYPEIAELVKPKKRWLMGIFGGKYKRTRRVNRIKTRSFKVKTRKERLQT